MGTDEELTWQKMPNKQEGLRRLVVADTEGPCYVCARRCKGSYERMRNEGGIVTRFRCCYDCAVTHLKLNHDGSEEDESERDVKCGAY